MSAARILLRACSYFLGVAVVCAIGASAATSPTRGGSLAQFIERGLPVFCGGDKGDEVALTFDDGPGPYSSLLVDELRWHAPATFFSIGENANANPVADRNETTVGVVGEHTETHAILSGLSRPAALAEIVDGRASVERATGKPVLLFRPPGDEWTLPDQSLVRKSGMLLVDYTVDPRDWALRTSSQVSKTVLSDPRLVPGAIVLLHENHLSTVEAVPMIVAALQRRGFKLVTVPRLLRDDPPTPAEQRADEDAHACVHLFER